MAYGDYDNFIPNVDALGNPMGFDFSSGPVDPDEEERRRKEEERKRKEAAGQVVQSQQVETRADGTQTVTTKVEQPAPQPAPGQAVNPETGEIYTPVPFAMPKARPGMAINPETGEEYTPLGAAPARPTAPAAAQRQPDFSISNIFKNVLRTESGGRHTDAQGNIITSPKGALGIAQIMPQTAANPGFGLRPLSQQELLDPNANARFGEQLLQKYTDFHNGDILKGVASYNAGPGRVKQAEQIASQRGGSWADYLPKETMGYIGKVFGALLPAAHAASLNTSQQRTQNMAMARATPTPAFQPEQQVIGGPVSTEAGAGRGFINPPMALDTTGGGGVEESYADERARNMAIVNAAPAIPQTTEQQVIGGVPYPEAGAGRGFIQPEFVQPVSPEESQQAAATAQAAAAAESVAATSQQPLSYGAFGEPLYTAQQVQDYKAQQTTLDPQLARYNDSQGDADKLWALSNDQSVDYDIRKQAKLDAADLLRAQSEEQKAKDKISKMPPKEIARELSRPSKEEGSWVKYLLFGLLGIGPLAAAEAVKLGIGAKTQYVTDSEGNTYKVKVGMDGEIISGVDNKQKPISEEKLVDLGTIVANTKEKWHTGAELLQGSDGNLYQTQESTTGKKRTVDLNGNPIPKDVKITGRARDVTAREMEDLKQRNRVSNIMLRSGEELRTRYGNSALDGLKKFIEDAGGPVSNEEKIAFLTKAYNADDKVLAAAGLTTAAASTAASATAAATSGAALPAVPTTAPAAAPVAAPTAAPAVTATKPAGGITVAFDANNLPINAETKEPIRSAQEGGENYKRRRKEWEQEQEVGRKERERVGTERAKSNQEYSDELASNIKTAAPQKSTIDRLQNQIDKNPAFWGIDTNSPAWRAFVDLNSTNENRAEALNTLARNLNIPANKRAEFDAVMNDYRNLQVNAITGSGLTASQTNTERESQRVMGTIGSISDRPAAAKAVLEYAKAKIEYTEAKAAAWAKARKQPGADRLSFETQFDQNEGAKIFEKANKRMADILGGRAAGAQAPGAPAVGTVKGGYRFKGGDPANKNNWEKL